jgi:hypothetical protein
MRGNDTLSIFYPDGQTLLHRFVSTIAVRVPSTRTCAATTSIAPFSASRMTRFHTELRRRRTSHAYVLHAAYTRLPGVGNDAASEALIRRAGEYK